MRGQLDCVLLALPYACGEVAQARLFDDAFQIAFHKSEPPSSAAHVAADDIDAERLLLLEDGHCLKDHALAACNRPELRADAAILGTSLHTLVQMVDNRLGLTLLPQMAVDAGILNGTDVEARPLAGERAKREIALIWRPASPRGDEFRMLADALKADR
jgi:LysR family transcriptional regulator, hydrogen peroxide-inducible genes activator